MLSPHDFGFDTEKAFLQAAADDDALREKFRCYVDNYVEREITEIIRLRGFDCTRKSDLIADVMIEFDKLFNNFILRGYHNTKEYNFTEYLRWWIKLIVSNDHMGDN